MFAGDMPDDMPYDAIASVMAHVARCRETPGWAVIGVGGDGPDSPPFAYTVGLWAAFGHAELLLAGLEYQMAAELLNNTGTLIAAGRDLLPGEVLHEARVANVPLHVRAVAIPSIDAFGRPTVACRHYQFDAFPLLQLLWPDKRGAFPTEPHFWPLSTPLPALDAGLAIQPLLPAAIPR